MNKQDSDYILELRHLCLPSYPDSTYEFVFGVSILEFSLTERYVSFVMDWLTYNDGEIGYGNSLVWAKGSNEMIDELTGLYRSEIASKLLAILDQHGYDEAESNPYPDW